MQSAQSIQTRSRPAPHDFGPASPAGSLGTNSILIFSNSESSTNFEARLRDLQSEDAGRGDDWSQVGYCHNGNSSKPASHDIVPSLPESALISCTFLVTRLVQHKVGSNLKPAPQTPFCREIFMPPSRPEALRQPPRSSHHHRHLLLRSPRGWREPRPLP